MQLRCQECGQAIQADDVNIDLAIAKCRGCNAVFSFADQLPKPPAGGAFSSSAARTKPEVAQPTRFRVEEWGPDLSISFSWYTHGVWALVFFCVIWDGFLVVWYSMALGAFAFGKGGGAAGMGIGLFFLAFPLIHVAVGVALTYGCLVTFVNRTVLQVSAGEFSIWSGPLPTWGNRRIPAHEIEQFYVTEIINSGRRSTSINYGLKVLLRDKQRISLLTMLQSPEEARYLEQKLEAHLKIADERTPGEYAW